MKLGFWKKKRRVFLVLDIGTEAVKALSCQKENNGKIKVLGRSLEYFEKFGVFEGKDFDALIMKKAIFKAIEKIHQKKAEILLSLPPNIFKARITKPIFIKERPKEKISRKEQSIILNQVFEKAQKRIAQKFAKDFGILENDIQWIAFKILDIKIEGYPVKNLKSYEGKELEFKILVTFLPKYYFENIEKIFQELGWKISKIIHLAEVISAAFKNKISDGVFIDIGGNVSQILILRNEQLTEIREINQGGEFFTQELSQTLGIDKESARILKERYSRGELSQGSTERIRELFSQEKRIWRQENLVHLFSSPIFLFGGGSLLPEIKKSFPGAKVFKNPQYTPALLLCQKKFTI